MWRSPPGDSAIGTSISTSSAASGCRSSRPCGKSNRGATNAPIAAQAHTTILAAAFGNSSAIDPSLFDYLKLAESTEAADPHESEAVVRGVLHRAED